MSLADLKSWRVIHVFPHFVIVLITGELFAKQRFNSPTCNSQHLVPYQEKNFEYFLFPLKLLIYSDFKSILKVNFDYIFSSHLSRFTNLLTEKLYILYYKNFASFLYIVLTLLVSNICLFPPQVDFINHFKELFLCIIDQVYCF